MTASPFTKHWTEDALHELRQIARRPKTTHSGGSNNNGNPATSADANAADPTYDHLNRYKDRATQRALPEGATIKRYTDPVVSPRPKIPQPNPRAVHSSGGVEGRGGGGREKVGGKRAGTRPRTDSSSSQPPQLFRNPRIRSCGVPPRQDQSSRTLLIWLSWLGQRLGGRKANRVSADHGGRGGEREAGARPAATCQQRPLPSGTRQRLLFRGSNAGGRSSSSTPRSQAPHREGRRCPAMTESTPFSWLRMRLVLGLVSWGLLNGSEYFILEPLDQLEDLSDLIDTLGSPPSLDGEAGSGCEALEAAEVIINSRDHGSRNSLHGQRCVSSFRGLSEGREERCQSQSFRKSRVHSCPTEAESASSSPQPPRRRTFSYGRSLQKRLHSEAWPSEGKLDAESLEARIQQEMRALGFLSDDRFHRPEA